MQKLQCKEINNLVKNFKEFLIVEKNLGNNSINAYITDINNFINYLTIERILNKHLDEKIIYNYNNYLFNKKFNNSSICRKLSSLRQFIKFLASEKYIEEDLGQLINLPKTEKKLPKFLSLDEIKLLLNKLKSEESFAGKRFSLMVNLSYSSALRVSEMVSLKKSNICFKKNKKIENFMIIVGKGCKERLIPLNQISVRMLEIYLPYHAKSKFSESDYLFPSNSNLGYISRQYFAKQLKQLAIDVGLNPELISPHILRHSLATHLLSNGADLKVIQEILGHENISTTEIYTHISNSELDKTLLKNHPIASWDFSN